ncbi:MAG: single-stranded DNA-binding protein, partial [Lachnospirales bacterium]
QSTQPIAVTRFSVAVNRKFKKDGEPEADFINCVSFGKTAEFISKYFTKGKMIGIVGSIRTNSWMDSATGQKRFSTDVLVEEVEFCGSKADETSGNVQQQNEDYYIEEEVEEDDNLPF